MAEINDIIEKFWKGELDAEGTRRLEKLLSENEGELQEKLKTDYQSLLASGSIPDKIAAASSARILHTLHSKIQFEKSAPVVSKFRLYPLLKWAACFLLIAMASVFAFHHYRQDQPKPQTYVSAVKDAFGKNYSNRQQKDIRIVLPDASIVLLSPKSTLHYLADFGVKTRKVYLEGKAEFKVFKDRSRPFSVYANQVATTALGTRFIVNTFHKNHTVVKLIEGRVVVHSAEQGSFRMKDTYLKPGDQLQVNSTSGLLKLNPKKAAISKAIQEPIDLSALEFKQEHLASVLKSLEKRYHKTIGFNPAELNGLSFTGTVRPSDQLKDILNILCTMNNLEFIEKGQTFIIRKPEN